jgi:predicted ATP-dependent protease
MSEFDDAILPDDFESDLPQSDEITEEPTELVEDNLEPSVETEQQQPQVEQPLTFKVKYNKEEQELTYDDAVPLIQKGMNYDKMQERLQALESDPRLNFVEGLARQQGMNVDEYLQAVQEFQQQEELNTLIQQNIPEEYAREMLETRKFREQIEAERKTKSEQERQNAEYNDFFHYFKGANGRDYDANTDQIPQEVWDIHANGVPLKYAYMEHHSNQLASQVKVLKHNESNKKKAPIASLSAHGSQEVASEDDFLRGFNSI